MLEFENHWFWVPSALPLSPRCPNCYSIKKKNWPLSVFFSPALPELYKSYLPGLLITTLHSPWSKSPNTKMFMLVIDWIIGPKLSPLPRPGAFCHEVIQSLHKRQIISVPPLFFGLHHVTCFGQQNFSRCCKQGLKMCLCIPADPLTSLPFPWDGLRQGPTMPSALT